MWYTSYVNDAGVDFKMIVTAIGAYQGNFGNKESPSFTMKQFRDCLKK